MAPLLPIVIPLMVMMKGNVSMTAMDVVMTTEVELGLLHTTEIFATLVAPGGIKGVDGAKKLEG